MEAIYFLFLFIFIISKVRKLFWNLNKTIKNFEDSNEHIIKPLCTNIFKDHATSHLTITKTSVVNEFLCMRVCVFALIVSYSLWPHGLQPSRLLCPWDFPGKNTGVFCQFLLQGIFPTHGSNLPVLCLLHWQVGSLSLAQPGKQYVPGLSNFNLDFLCN